MTHVLKGKCSFLTPRGIIVVDGVGKTRNGVLLREQNKVEIVLLVTRSEEEQEQEEMNANLIPLEGSERFQRSIEIFFARLDESRNYEQQEVTGTGVSNQKRVISPLVRGAWGGLIVHSV